MTGLWAPAAFVFSIAVTAGCTGADQVSIPDATTPATDEPTTIAPAITTDDAPDAPDDVPPARRVPDEVSSETTHWVGHGFMTDNKIEIVWSEVEGADVVYQIFRFDEIGFDPAEVELVDPIHEGIGTLGWDDASVVSGSFYTYVMRVIADDQVLERRWTATLAVTDTTPPTMVTDLTATATTEGVLLEWSPSQDDVEFGSYGVYRSDGDQPKYIGGGGDQEVTAFIDTEVPSSGEISYEVRAADFHGNQSEPAAITVSLG